MNGTPPIQSSPGAFIYLACQRGAESALKAEMTKKRPDFKFSYSRPGFLTYKTSEGLALNKKLGLTVESLRLVFARSCVLSLGSIDAKSCADASGQFDASLACEATWRLWESASASHEELRSPARLHVYQRDAAQVGAKGFEPGANLTVVQTHRRLLECAPQSVRATLSDQAQYWQAPAREGELCIDVAIVEPNRWMIGFHKATDFHSRYPGGLLPMKLPTDAASRAFLKFEEGLRWADFPITLGSRCVDIGASPGGGSQALLARGAFVLGVDPALIDPRVMAHPNFTHLRGKINQLKRKNFRKSRWFITDMNVAPKYTLDALEEIVARDDIAARGLLFTLKIFEWKLAQEIPSYIRRVKSWGFNHVKARQLQFNRQEIMIAALKKPFRH